MTQTKICVIGTGNWGINHVRTLHRLGALGGCVDPNSDRQARLKKDFPDVPVFSDLREALKHPFDGYTVATPVRTHFEIAKFLIENKKPVLVEKPLSLNVHDAEELVRLARENKVKLMTGHVLLFHPAMRKIRELIDGGKIGKLQYLYSNRLNLGTIRQEENALWSFAPHDISIFQSFIGQQPVEVSATGGAFLQPHLHDVTITTLRYPNNIVGHIFVSWLHPFKEHRLVIIGSKGMLAFEDSSEKKEILFYEKGFDWQRGEPVKRDGATEVIAYDRAEPLAEEMKSFIGRLNGVKCDTASGESAIEVLRILEKASASLDLPHGMRMPAGKSESLPYFIHESAVVDLPCKIGKGTHIWHYSHIMKEASIGENCSLGQNCFVAKGVKIGNHVKIQNNVSLYEGVEIEDEVFLGPSCVLTNVKNPRSEISRKNEYKKTLIRRGATVGANATIVCGTIIGRYAFIAAGATVTKDVPDYALMMGTPAHQDGWMSRHGARLKKSGKDWICPLSGWKYKLTSKGLECLSTDSAKPLAEKAMKKKKK